MKQLTVEITRIEGGSAFAQVWGFDNLNRVVWIRNLQDNFFTIRLGPFVRLLFALYPDQEACTE